MTVWVFRSGQMVDRDTVPAPSVKRGDYPCPQVASDIKEYMSPAGTGMITSRSHRREDLKRNNCRDLDPSEAPKLEYQNPKYAKRYGAEARKKMRAAGIKAGG